MSFFSSSTPSAFGQPQQQTANTGFSFGSQQQPNSAFGAAPNPTPTNSLFGANNAAPPSQGTFGSFGQNPSSNTNTGFGGGSFGMTSNFGANNNTQQSAPTNAFGTAMPTNANSGNALSFGSAAPSSGFNMNSLGTNNFGASAMTGTSAFGSGGMGNTMAVPQNRGTGDPPYTATLSTGTGADSGGKIHSICAMPAYINYSMDELRLQDYKMGKLQRGAGLGSGATASFGGTQTVAPTNAFGTQGGFGAQSASPFGNNNQQNSSGFGKPANAFGGMSNSLTGPSAFGGNNATSGGFGSGGTSAFGTNTNTSNTNAFGAQQPTPAFGGGFGGNTGASAFGQPNTGFGTNASSNQPGSTNMGLTFGNTATQQQPGATQNTGFGMFGAAANKPAFGGMNTGGLMGSNTLSTATSTAPSTGTFGFNTANQGGTGSAFGGGLGANNAQQPSAFGGGSTMFGAAATSQPQQTTSFGSGGLFGNTQQQANTTSQPAFGSTNPAQPFGALNAPKPMLGGFNTNPAGSTSTSGGLFGGGTATNTFQMGTSGQSKPAAPFGNTFTSTLSNTPASAPGTNTGMFGGGGLFGAQKPGIPASSALGNTFGTSTTGFGTAPGGFSMQQQPLFQQQQPNQGSMFANSTSQMMQSLTASVDQNPYGKSALFDLVPESVVKTVQDHPLGASLLRLKPADIEEASTREAAMSMSSLVKISPSQVTKSRLRIAGFHETSSLSQPYALTRPSANGHHSSTRSMDSNPLVRSNTRYSPDNSSSLSMTIPPVSFTPRSSVKRLDVRPTEVVHIPFTITPTGSLSMRTSKTPYTPDTAMKPMDTPSKPPRGAAAIKYGLAKPRLTPMSPYEIKPTLHELESMTLDQRRSVNNLTVIHPEFGSVTFLQPVDLSEINLMQICGTLVRFVNGEFIMYGDEQANPSEKRSLDVLAKVTLLGKWPLTKTRQVKKTVDPNDPVLKAYIERLRQCRELVFQHYDSKLGAWTFLINSTSNTSEHN